MYTVEKTFIKTLKEQGKVYHPSLGKISRRDKEALPYYFDPEYGDWVAPTEPGHDAVAGIKSWRMRNPLVPEENRLPDVKESISRKGDWKKYNPLVSEDDIEPEHDND